MEAPLEKSRISITFRALHMLHHSGVSEMKYESGD